MFHCWLLDIPFTNGIYTNNGFAFYSLTSSSIRSDTSIIAFVVYYLVSTNLKNQISSSLEFDHSVVCQPLTISSNSDCNKLLQNGWKSITVNEGLCNSMTNNLYISYYPCLESILVKKNSLKNLNSLAISNNPQLSNIVIQDGDWETGAFKFVKSVELSSNI